MKTNTAYRITTIFAFLAATALCVPAHAETALHAGGWSYHIVTGNKVDYTSSHDLVAVEHKRVFAARFRNSFGKKLLQQERKLRLDMATMQIMGKCQQEGSPCVLREV